MHLFFSFFSGGSQYAGEAQLHGFNADLYDNYTVAANHPNGLVGMSILIQIGQLSNPVLRKITEVLPSIQYRGISFLQYISCKLMQENILFYFSKGDKNKLENVTIAQVLPETYGYMTYDGSQTEPGCSETVTWIIMNRPIYITHKQVNKSDIFCQGKYSKDHIYSGRGVEDMKIGDIFHIVKCL